MSFDDKTVPGKPTITHDPEAILDYGWALGSLIDDTDSIDTASFVAPDGAQCTLGSITGTTVYGWLSITDRDSLLGKTIGVTCHWATTNGRTDERTLFFKIKDR